MLQAGEMKFFFGGGLYNIFWKLFFQNHSAEQS